LQSGGQRKEAVHPIGLHGKAVRLRITTRCTVVGRHQEVFSRLHGGDRSAIRRTRRVPSLRRLAAAVAAAASAAAARLLDVLRPPTASLFDVTLAAGRNLQQEFGTRCSVGEIWSDSWK
jgi:hypothetical protein